MQSNTFKILILILCPIIWPFLNFINANRGENYSEIKLLIIIGSTLFLFLILYLILKVIFYKKLSFLECALLLSIFIISFFSYFLTSIVASMIFSGKFLTTWLFFCTFLLILTFLLRNKKPFQNFLVFVNILLVFFPVIEYVFYNLNTNYNPKINSSKILNGNNSYSERDKIINELNVFFIILDTYGREDYLKYRYDYDNSKFISKLEEEGFVISKNSTSNYTTTNFSLTSVLAKDYIFRDKMLKPEIDTKINNIFYKNQNPVYEFFKKNNYLVSSLMSNGKDCDSIKVDFCFSSQQLTFTDLEKNLLSITPINSLIDPLKKLISLYHNNTIIGLNYFEFKDVKQFLNKSNFKKPFFIDAHMMIPHGPFRFSENCKRLKSLEKDWYKGYLNQIKCANLEMIETINIIKNKYPNTIIIVASDTGPSMLYLKKYKLNNIDFIGYNYLKQIDKIDIVEKESVLSNLMAWYIPTDLKCKNFIYNDMSLVNTFRLVEGCLMNTNPKLLDNRWFYFDKINDSFIEVFK